MTRNNTLVRVLQLMELLLRQPMTLAEISAEFGVSQRTAIRDLAAIDRAGAMVTLRRWQTDGDRGGLAFCYRASLAIGAQSRIPRAARPATTNFEAGR